jgi:DNA helicase-2/ATP-dependent DNA helicase PcrA
MVGTVSTSLEKVIECIEAGKSFIVEAGAGSGKTWTLIESLKQILATKSLMLEKANQKIACITYTNVAKDQIIERIENNPLVLVLTIHEFLWFVMKNNQKELKEEILKFNKADEKKPVEDLETKIQKVTVEYSQYGRKFENGKITHEDVLEFSSILFKTYPKIATIVANKFPYLFIDEYQDTEPRTVELLLDNLLEKNKNRIVVGFFGDSMQKIYSQGVGKIPKKYIDDCSVIFITKAENFRCSKKVIDLLGKIRPDLIQTPAGNNLEGTVSFIQCNNNLPNEDANFFNTLKFLETKKSWNFSETSKILYLTHKGIASKLGYENLLEVYGILPYGRDSLLNKDELFANFILNKLETMLQFYLEKDYRSFIKVRGTEGLTINSHEDKLKLRLKIDALIQLRNEKAVKEVLDFVFKNELLAKPIKIEELENEIAKSGIDENLEIRKKFYDKLMSLKYSEFILINKYIEDSTPYSTKHGVKGAEYENVLVIINDALWNQYKFNDVFANNKKNEQRFERGLNLLYVCCSRAKNNLVLLALSKMDANAMKTISEWFGEENVRDVKTLD